MSSLIIHFIDDQGNLSSKRFPIRGTRHYDSSHFTTDTVNGEYVLIHGHIATLYRWEEHTEPTIVLQTDYWFLD